MRTSVLSALLGAVAGFTAVVLLNLFVLPSPFVRAVLFPGNVFLHYATNKGTGDFGQMIFDFLAYFANILLYAAVGFGIGKLLEGRRGSQAKTEEGQND